MTSSLRQRARVDCAGGFSQPIALLSLCALVALATDASAQPALAPAADASKPSAPASAPAGQPTSQPQSVPASAPSAPASARHSRRLRVVFTSDLFGRLAWPGCKRAVALRDHAELGHLAGAVRQFHQLARSQGEPDPVVVHAGSFTQLDALGGYLMQQPARSRRAVTALNKVGFDAISIGPHDLRMSMQPAASYLEQSARVGLPLVTSNLACDAKSKVKDARCDGLRKLPRYRVLRRGDITIGVVSLLRADQLTRLPLSLRGALTVSDPLTTARADITALRKLGADVVIALSELNVEGAAPKATAELVSKLGEDGPDITVAGNMFDRGRPDYVFSVKRGSGRVIVGTDRFGQTIGEVLVSLAPRDETRGSGSRYVVRRLRVRRLRVAQFPPEPKLALLARRFMREFCRAEDRPLGNARFASPMVFDDFVTLAAEVMRRQVGAEIALVERSAFADTSFPLGGVMTRAKLLRAVRTRAPVGIVRVTGEKLVALLKDHASDTQSALYVVGLRKEDDRWLVNERPVVDGQRYVVATTRFVASGGDQLISADDLKFQKSKSSLFSLLSRYFSRRRDGAVKALHRELSLPSQRILLAGSARLTTSLAVSAISNGTATARYSRPLLRRDSVTTLAVELALFGSASTIDHSVEADVQIQYGRTWTTTQGSDNTSAAEAQDRFAANLLYRFSRLRNRFGKRWYIAEPYAELNLVSELTPSGTFVDAAGVTQTYHLLDLAAAVGLGLSLHPLLFVKLGFVVRGEALTPPAADPDLPTRAGIYVGYTLRRIKVGQQSSTPLELESRLDVVVTDLGAAVRRDVTWQNQLSVDLFDYIKLAVTQRLYVFDTNQRDVSLANDVTVGLSFGIDRRLQTY